MGQIINVPDGETNNPEALTSIVESGFRSGEYLRDQPAIEVVEEQETVQFVVTNRRQGVAIRGETTSHVLPDSPYQTVVVVTDRRVVALVGKVGGDRQLSLDIAEITDVRAATKRQTGRLTIKRADGPTWAIQTGTNGLTEVASYLRNRSDEHRNGSRVYGATRSIRGLVESTLDSAKAFDSDQVAELVPSRNNSGSGPDSTKASSAKQNGQASSDKSDTQASSAQRNGQASETTERPEKSDIETAIDEILQALAKTDWTARSAQSESPFDLLAEREDELVGVVVHCPADGRIPRSTIKRCEMITGAAGTDTVMLATTGTVRDTDAQRAAELGVRLRNVETLRDTADPPTIAAVTEMVTSVLERADWSVRSAATGPFDLLADRGDELLGVIVHSPEDGTVRSSINRCDVVTGAAGTDTVMLATTGTVRDDDRQLAEELGVRLVESAELAQHHVTEIENG